MNEYEFEQKYMTGLDSQQREAVKACGCPVLLLAVPGSGKTSVLVTRLGYLTLVCGIPAEKILAVTYTVAATREMKSRYSSLFGREGAGVPEFRTINGLSQKIIDCYGSTCSRSDPFLLEDRDGETERLLRELYREINKEYADDSTVKDLRTGITYVKNMMLTDAETEKYECGVNGFSEIFRRYNAELRSHRRMDYDDQLVYACRILKQRPQILQIFRDRYSCICVDEAQDTSKVQHAIIRLLAGDRPDLFMVGDEDQSIYGFRAAYPEALVRFREDYPGARILYLEQNYRSTPEIVEAANRFVSGSRERYPKVARAVRESGKAVSRISAANRMKQFEMAYEAVKEAVSTGRETAFLFRNNDSAVPLIDLCERDQMPYNCRKFDEVFFSDRIVTDFFDIAAFVRQPSNTELFMRIYYKFNCYIPKTAAEDACRKASRSGEPVFRTLFQSRLMKAYAREAVLDLHHQFHRLEKDTAAQAVSRICDEMGYDDYVRNRGMDDAKLDTLLLLAGQEQSLFSLMDRLNALRTIIANHENRNGCPVIFSTIHSAKGLEYDRVYLLDVYDGLFPSVSAAETKDPDKKKLYQEERRLFYVGMTRAKNELVLITQGRRASFIDEVTEDPSRSRRNRSGDTGMVRKNGLFFPKKDVDKVT